MIDKVYGKDYRWRYGNEKTGKEALLGVQCKSSRKDNENPGGLRGGKS